MAARFSCTVLVLMSLCSCLGQRLDLPEPPQQRKPWHPPAADVPTNLLSAVNSLFEQGFPDPRGCEYREIEVEVSSIWDGKGRAVQTRGWVLPEKAGQTQRFAICWNGLIYPVATVGAAADLHAEAVNLSPPTWRRFNSAFGEVILDFASNSPSTRVLLLLQCGETEAARKNWAPDQRFMTELQEGMNKPETEIGKRESYDPYLELAGDWAWALFDRTICAHMRGDEALALATARKLAEVQPKIEAEAAKRGFPREQYYDSARKGKEKPYLDFLDQLPQLLADLERRAREGKRVSAVESGLQKIPNQAGRIAALMRDLDLVQARQWSQPGWVNLAEDPVVTALVQEGDAAVEPLLDCLETDKRLTRSVGFHRDFFRSRTVIPVASAARTALQMILQAESRGGAPEIRAYWDKYKGLKIEDRWYAILKDGSAGMERWREAAANITRPENMTSVPGIGFSTIKLAPTNAPVRLRGEVLRGKSNPSVSALMTRRALQVAPADSDATYDLANACEIGLCLAAWDSQAVAPTAKALVERCRTVMEYSDQGSSWPVQRLGSLIARLTMARVQAGDPHALEDYAAWLKTMTPEQLESYLSDSLEPLSKFPSNDVLQAAADSLFNDTNSVWSRLPWKGAGFHKPVETELVNVPAFRRLVSRELDKREVCGTIEWLGPGTAGFQITNYLSGSRGLALPEGERPATRTETDLRWCDWIAWSLFNAKQIPFFNPFAPVEKRDDIIRDAKALLDR